MELSQLSLAAQHRLLHLSERTIVPWHSGDPHLETACSCNRNGGRIDDVEFTFKKGNKAKTLGEATLRNRVKSHQDVGERWYPDVLRDLREEWAAVK